MGLLWESNCGRGSPPNKSASCGHGIRVRLPVSVETPPESRGHADSTSHGYVGVSCLSKGTLVFCGRKEEPKGYPLF